MKLVAKRIAYGLVLVPAVALASGCGQRPAFGDKTSTRSDVTAPDGAVGGPGDATAGNANGPGAGAQQGEPGSSTDQGINGKKGGGSPGSDSTDGDKTPSDHPGKGGGGDTGTSTGTGTGGDTPDPGGSDGNKKTKTTVQTFPADQTMTASVTHDLASAYLTQTFTLIRNYVAKTVTQTQIKLANVTDTFTQGTSGASNTETFDQTANRPLDIVAITDDSGSMRDMDASGQTKQQKVATRVMDLLNNLGDTDWQIGVVTTNPNEGALRALIKKSDANFQQAFQNAWMAPLCDTGSDAGNCDNERGILQSVRSIVGYNLPQTWVRPNSNIAVLIVSDEDNCSAASVTYNPNDPGHSNDCPNKPYAQANYLTDYLAQVRVLGKTAKVYGIFWGANADGTPQNCSLGYNQGVTYQKAVDTSGGVWGSICDLDYTPTLRRISADVQVSLQSNFTLQFTPDPTTVKVFVGTTQVPSTGFSVQGNVVTLLQAPPAGSKITVSYKYGATPILSSFPLKAMPASAARTTVSVNGTVVDPSTYTVDFATQSIDFVTAPADHAAISVTYAKAQALTSQWSLGEAIKPGSLVVQVNGQTQTSGYTETDAVGLIAFNPPPPEGATVVFSYKAVGAPVYTYPFAGNMGNPADVVAYDASTMAPVKITYDPGKGTITVATSDYVEGRQITVRYDNVARQSFEVDLPNLPIPGSVKAIGGSVTCTAAGDLVVTDEKVEVSGCGFANDVTQVRIDYTYVSATLQDFTFKADPVPAAGDFQQWTVWVNNVETTNYTRAGTVFHFAQPLPFGAVVKIQLVQYTK